MTFRVVRTNQYNQDLGLIHSTNGNHLESPNEGSSIDHQAADFFELSPSLADDAIPCHHHRQTSLRSTWRGDSVRETFVGFLVQTSKRVAISIVDRIRCYSRFNH
ncbi:hypothetical protein F511_27486 [Dorcoceras hygrometricum]|uniref:Uncharacterized protein n=1 Tax=Dorcoceras hygrometricum TaxID=472368 RepID=A0A2Z7CRJ6_9LAMI|nr:hypothetical protein F511_27486 [Dorcoceras hygrometricum]